MSDKTYTDLVNERKNDERFDKIVQFETHGPLWTSLDQVISESQPWFWPGIIPNATLTLFAGVGGIGKSLLLLYIAAKTSSGELFKAGGLDHQLPAGSVLLLSAEDNLKHQIRPKLLGMEANPSKIHHITSRISSVYKTKKFLELDKDIYVLEKKIQELGDVKLIVIDPIAYFIGELRDHINKDVANFLQSLIDLAERYNLAIILNKHLRKQASGTKASSAATNEVGGAGAWTNTPRKCWLITDHHEQPEVKVITQMKDNLSKKNKDSLAFKIIPSKVTEINDVTIECTTLAWLDQTVSMSSDEAVSKDTYEKSKIDTAIDLITSYLEKNGKSLRVDIESCLLKKGITRATFLRALPKFEKMYADILTISFGYKNAKCYEMSKL